MKIFGGKRLFILLAMIMIVGMITILFVIPTRTPIKYAVRIEDVGDYPDSILVKEAWHTGTKWEQVGDDTGYLSVDQRKDVYLLGKIPPMASVGGDHVNTYLCVVNYLGEDHFPAIGESQFFDKYEVVEWYPVYPVKRDTILPAWFYPDNYLSRADVRPDWNL
jgi:hypothetical protein